MTNMTKFPLFPRKRASLRDQSDIRHVRHVRWSERCEHDEVGGRRDPIWIGDAIAEWLEDASQLNDNHT